MGIFRHFPYSNFHEMNLDWLLAEWKKYADQYNIVLETVENLSALFEDFKKFLESGAYSEAIKEQLDEWLDEGIFDDMIREIVIPQRNLVISRVGRYISKKDAFIGSQTMCYDGEFMYMAGQDTIEGNTKQYVSKANLNGVILQTEEFANLIHAGSITADENNLYVATDATPEIIILNKETLVETDIITIADFIKINSVCFYNDKLYLTGISNPQFIDFGYYENNEFVLLHQIAKPLNKTYQNFTIFNNTIYMLYCNSNTIYSYDLATGNLLNGYNIPAGDGYYPTGEPEDMLIINNDIYLYSASYYRYLTIEFLTNNLFKTNLINDTIIQSDSLYKYMESESRLMFFVDPSYTFEFNPYDHFQYIEEACLIANYHRTGDFRLANFNNGSIKLINGYYTINATTGNKHFDTVWAENSIIRFDTNQTNLTINNLKVDKCEITIHRAKLTGDLDCKFTTINLRNVNLTDLETITTSCSQWIFNTITAINDDLTVNGDTTSGLEIHALAINNLLLLCKIGNASGSFTVYGANKIYGFRLTQSMVAAQAINVTTDGLNIKYEDGEFTSGIQATTLLNIKLLPIS